MEWLQNGIGPPSTVPLMSVLVSSGYDTARAAWTELTSKDLVRNSEHKL